MEFDNSFEIPLSPDQAWPVLMDVARIAPCMPGAELTEITDPQQLQRQNLGPARSGVARLRGPDRAQDIDDCQTQRAW